ncbi:MAG TPA: hypothetical protein VMB74_04345 [Streptosporangiaceae bacterium]|nr:hypothetical protein [Streptosporangiaceae bacterium]
MQADPRVAALYYLMGQLRSRIGRVRSGDLELGALSLEWVAIAIVLVTAALALAAFLTGKLSDLEKLIPD